MTRGEEIASNVLVAALRLPVFALFYWALTDGPFYHANAAWAAGCAAVITLALVAKGPFEDTDEDEDEDE